MIAADMRALAEPAWTGPAPGSARRNRALRVLGFAWGLIASFTAAITTDRGVGLIFLGTGLLLAVLTTLVAGRAVAFLTGWIVTWPGALMSAHVAAAVISGLANGSPSGAVMRYVLLLPAMVVMIAAARVPEEARALQVGLTGAGVAFVAYHVPSLTPSSLVDPMARISLFINTNAVGFISAMTGVSTLTLIPRRPRLAATMGWIVVVACVLLCFATKSRTSLLAGLSGVAVIVYRRARSSPALRRAIVGVAAVLVLAFATTGAGRRVATGFVRLYSIQDEYRSVATGTSRYDAWRYVVHEQWLPNFFLGVGPGRHGPALEAAIEVTSAHNGVLLNLGEVGALGTAPLLLLLGLAIARARGTPESAWALPLVVTGIVESGAETMFFSMGNSASLLFLLGVAALASPPIAEPLTVDGGDRRV